MPSLLVTVGTDGQKDWVQTPDGQKFSLGPVSVLSFVSKLTKSSKAARSALDEFLKRGETLLAVDDDHMWTLLQPQRARWATGPFMSSEQRDPSPRNANMSTIQDDLAAMKKVVGHLNTLAKQGQQSSEAVGQLIKLAQKIKSPNQSTNSTYYNLGAPKVYEVGDAAPKVNTVNASDLSIDTYEANMKITQSILDRARETVGTINRLASQGKRFNAARARADVGVVTNKVANICSKTELTESWVRDDLLRLAAQNDNLHGLFHPRAE